MKGRNARLAAGALGITVFAGALGACSADGSDGASSGGDGSGEPTTITFLHPHPDGYNDVIADFEEAYPDIRVEEQSIPFNEMISQVQARLGSQDDSLDVIAVDPPRLPNMVSSGFLDEVTDPNLASTVIDTGLSSVTFEDKQWAYPIWTSANLLFYNKELLDAAGIEHPSSDPSERMTWAEVTEDAALAQAAGAQYGFGMAQIDRYYTLQPLIMSSGGGAGLGGEDGLTVDITDPGWQAFGEWYHDIHDSGVAPRGIDPSQMQEVMATGQVAYYLSGPTRISELTGTAVDGKWGIAPHPYFDGGDIVTPTDSWAMGVSAYSSKKEAAHTFLRYMSLTTEGAVAATSQLNLPPVNIEAYPRFIERMVEANPDELATFEAIITEDNTLFAEQRPSSVGFVEFETITNKVFADIRNGADPAEVLTSAEDDIVRQLAKYQ